MNTLQEQLVALGGVFQAAVLVDRIARTGQASEANIGCMLGSLLVRDPKDTLEVFGGDDLNLRDGYRALVGALERDPSSLQREPLRYALSMLGLERQLAISLDAAIRWFLAYLWERRDTLLVLHPWFAAAYEDLAASAEQHRSF